MAQQAVDFRQEQLRVLNQLRSVKVCRLRLPILGFPSWVGLLLNSPVLIANEDDPRLLAAGGAWNVANVEVLERVCAGAAKADIGAIDLGGVTALDTVGAWLLERLARGGTTRAALTGADGTYGDLLDEVRGLNRSGPPIKDRSILLLEKLDQLGRGSRRLVTDSAAFLHMLGALSAALLGVARHPRSFRLTSTVYQLGRVGWQAVPIMALITFLIGAIIAQQGSSISAVSAPSPMSSTWWASWCCAKSVC